MLVNLMSNYRLASPPPLGGRVGVSLIRFLAHHVYLKVTRNCCKAKKHFILHSPPPKYFVPSGRYILTPPSRGSIEQHTTFISPIFLSLLQLITSN